MSTTTGAAVTRREGAGDAPAMGLVARWRAWSDAHSGEPQLDVALPVPAAADRAAWDPAGTLDIPTREAVAARAAAELGSPWPAPTAHAYARYWRDGDRTEYEDAVAARQRRLSRALVVAATTLDPVWIDEVADGVTALCEQSTWCWAAHDDTRARHGALVATITDPFLDLGAGEVAGQLAWVDHVLGDVLDERYPGLRARVRREVRVRVLHPFVARRDWHWLGLDGDVHNWNPWIHGNVLVAALRFAEPAERGAVVGLVIEGLDRYVTALPDDGAVDEGYAYWWNGACRALEALDLLSHATAGGVDASGVPALAATVAFPHRMHLGGPWYLNCADGPARPPDDQPWAALHRAAVAAGDPDAAAHAAAHRRPGEPVADERGGLGRLLRAAADPLWLAARPGPDPLVRDVWLPSVQVLLARDHASADAPPPTTVAVKGGHNGEHHNHNDVGSFVVALRGVPVLVDPGRPTYTAQTFGPDRYSIWTMRSDWHNLPSIAGREQVSGAEHAARDVSVVVDDAVASWAGDIAPAYPGTRAGRWHRAVRFRRGHDVTVTDSWDLAAVRPDERSTLHLVLAGELDDVTDVGARVRALEGAGVAMLSWSAAVVDVRVERRELDDPVVTQVWGDHLVRLTLTLDHPVRGAVDVRFRPEGVLA